MIYYYNYYYIFYYNVIFKKQYPIIYIDIRVALNDVQCGFALDMHFII